MSTTIGLISDVHAVTMPVKQALDIFQQNNVDKIFCAGDIAGYGNELDATIELLLNAQCETIAGNHDASFLQSTGAKSNAFAANYLSSLATYKHYQIEGKQLYMVHAYPPTFAHGGIKLLDVKSKIRLSQKKYWSEQLAKYQYDVLVVGHTHQVFAEKLGNTLVINPGSTCFNHSCAILSLPEMSVEFFALSGKPISTVWNWSKFISE